MRNVVLILVILLLACGTGLLIYGILVAPEDFRSPLGLDLWRKPAEVSAWGAGSIVAGVLLFLGFGRKGKKGG